MSFDIEAFKAEIRRIPYDPLHREIRAALTDERTMQDAQPLVDASENAAATAFHEGAGHNLIDGTLVWALPEASYEAYPAGAKVTHLSQVWENQSAGIANGEPGTDPVWVAAV